MRNRINESLQVQNHGHLPEQAGASGPANEQYYLQIFLTLNLKVLPMAELTGPCQRQRWTISTTGHSYYLLQSSCVLLQNSKNNTVTTGEALVDAGPVLRRQCGKPCPRAGACSGPIAELKVASQRCGPSPVWLGSMMHILGVIPRPPTHSHFGQFREKKHQGGKTAKHRWKKSRCHIH